MWQRRAIGVRYRRWKAPAEHALAGFLRLGADSEILEPAALRGQAIQAVRDLAARYALT